MKIRCYYCYFDLVFVSSITKQGVKNENSRY